MVNQIILRIAAVVVTAITLVAALNLSATLEQFVRRFPDPIGLSGLGVVVVVGALSVASVWLLISLASRPRGRPWVPWIGVTLALAARLGVALMIDAPLRADAVIQNQLAIDVAEGACCFGHRPMGFPMLLGTAYGIFGVHQWVVEALNVLLGTLTALLVWALARQVWGAAAGALAIGLFAVVPSQVLLVAVPLSELTYALLLLAAIWAVAQWPRALIPAVAAGGVILALSHYVRPTSMALLPFLAAVPLVAGATLRRGALAAAVMVVVFVIALLPVVAFNLQAHDSPSISTSAYGGWSLFVGANQEFNGTWNPDDAAIVAELPGGSMWERSERAGDLAIERITADPRGYAELIVRKFNVMWADERYAVNYAVRHLGGRMLETVGLAAHLAYVSVLSLAAVAVWKGRQRQSSIMLAISLIIVAVAVMHLFVEVHGRYHAYVVPLLCVLAGAAAGIPAVARRLPPGANDAPMGDDAEKRLADTRTGAGSRF